MCRLFAYAGPGEDLRPYLVGPAPSLRTLACEHPHGWGFTAWSGPFATAWTAKAPGNAEKDAEFERAAAFAAPRMMAHIRHASVGGESLANTHPFAYGAWSWCHNGTLYGFNEGEGDPALRTAAPWVRALRVGRTDSEAAFLLFLDCVARLPRGLESTLEEAAPVLAGLAREVVDLGASREDGGANFLVGNGEGFLATRWGRELAVHKTAYATYVSSVPVGPGRDWTADADIPDGTLLIVRPGAIERRPF